MSEVQRSKRKPPSLLKVTLKGDKLAHSGAIPVPVLIEVCKALQAAVTHQLEAQGDKESITLELVRLGKGSTVLEFELAHATQRTIPGQNAGEVAVMALVEAVREYSAPRRLRELDEGTAETLSPLARVVGPDLRVALYVPKQRTPTLAKAVKATFSQALNERVSAVTRKEVRMVPQSLEGVVEMSDFKPSDHKFRLVTLYGSPITCTFDESKSEAVHRLTRSVVRVSGVAEVDPHGKVKTLRVEQIAPQGSPFGPWESKSISQLIAEQGVKPITDGSELDGIWPDNERKPN